MGLRVNPGGSVEENGNSNPHMSNGPRSPLARTRSEVMAHNILHDVDPWTAWMYKPHTIIVTMAGAALLVYVCSPSVMNPYQFFSWQLMNRCFIRGRSDQRNSFVRRWASGALETQAQDQDTAANIKR